MIEFISSLSQKRSRTSRPTYIPVVAGILVVFTWYINTAPPVLAQRVSVSASVNTTTVEAGETIRYTIQIGSSSTFPVTTPSPPELEGLELVRSRPRASRNVSIVRGRIHQQMTYEWTLRATRAGQAHIGSTPVAVDDSEHLTDPIEITVVGPSTARDNSSSSSSEARSGPPEHRSEDVFIRVRASETDVYANELVTVAYELYFREDFQIQNTRMADAWKADGLWREELNVDQRPIPETEVINGLRYNKITLKRSAFFPARTGSLQIDPLRIETEVLRPYRRDDQFNFRVPRDERLYSAEIASPPVTVHASPVPADRPSSFSGAVGSFTLSRDIDRRTVQAGEAVEFTVSISGEGNISTLGKSKLNVPPSIEQYNPRVENQIDRSNRIISGEKTLSYTLVPRKPGTYEIPPIEWSYFDPRNEQFITRRTDPVKLTVEPASSSASATAEPGRSEQDLAGVMDTPRSDAGATPPLHRQWWPYAGLAGPAGALLFLLGLRRWRNKKQRYDATPDQRARAAASRHLSRAEEFRRREQMGAFYEAIERAIRGFIGTHMEFPAQGLTTHQLDTRLREANVPEALRTTVRELLNTCEQARFSPTRLNNRTMDATYNRAANCLARLEGLLDNHTSDHTGTPA
jgi:hypothetical protein